VASIAVASVVAVCAIIGVAALIGWRATDCTRKLVPSHELVCKAFISTPQFLVWVMLLCAQAALWALAIVPLLRALRGLARGLREDGSLTGTTVAGIAVSAVALTTAAVLFAFAPRILPSQLTSRTRLPQQWPLPEHTLKVSIIVSVAIVIGVLAIVGIWMAGIALQSLPGKVLVESGDVERFLELRGALNGLLAFAGGIIGLATLSTGALRNAVLALNPTSPKYEFDAQYVLVYGLFFTGLLAIAYAPSFLALRAAGTWLRDASYPLPQPGSETFTTVLEQRSAFGDFLQVSLSASASFKAGAAIFAPLASSLVALLIPKLTGS